MSWRLAAFVLLAMVLAGGLGWYERSRPSSRIVALVAALAALAVAGRLVFAPIPNVQATTDIVLFTGYALGAAPGFAVGALAALISNLWLGQGPWTPWEMAGWGLVGAGGALLALVTRRRPGRVGLALACGLAGLAYGALMDFSVMATAGGSLTWDRYLAISARSIPFNAAHIAGNVALALAAGPALVRMISRYRSRLEFRWRPELVAPLLLVVALLPLLSQPSRALGSSSAGAWLAGAQNSDGGFGSGPGESSSVAMTGWAVLGLEAAGTNPLDLGSRTPVAYLREHIGTISSTGDLERTILALDAAGLNPRDFAGKDLVAKLESRRSRGGSFQGQVNLTAFGVLALSSAGESGAGLARSVAWLEHAQSDDGGWGFQGGVASDPDSTGAAMQAIAAGDPGAGALSAGVRYLRRDQNPDGGWPLGGAGPSNTQSTAWAIQGLIAAGVSPGAVHAGKHSGGDYLRARQAGDGHYRYSASSDQTPVWVTGQALLAAAGKAFPLPAVPRAPHTAASGGGRHDGGYSSGGTSAQSGSGGSGSGSGSTTTPPPGSSPGAGLPSGYFGGGGSSAFGGSGAFGGGAGKQGAPSGHASGSSSPAGTAESRRLFADVDVPKAVTPAAGRPSAGAGSHTRRDILIGVGALALLGGAWLGYRRFA